MSYDGRLHLIRRGEWGMLRDEFGWCGEQVGTDCEGDGSSRVRASFRTRYLLIMTRSSGIERLAARKAANAHKAASTSTSKQKGKNSAPQTNTVPAQPTNPAKEAMYDRLFTCKLPPPASIYFILIIDPAVAERQVRQQL
jgi:hypothetical protein